MRKYIILQFALLMTCFISTNAQLIIIEQDYEKARQESQLQNKLLIIDFYTTWCVPCKYLDKTIFRDTSVSNEIARDFILLRYNAEKDSTHQLSLKHHVGFYPTNLVLNKDQHVLHRMYGFGAEEKLVGTYKEFLKESIRRNSSNAWIKGVSSTTKLPYPSFYKEYVFRTNTKDINTKVKQYWSQVDKTEYFSELSFILLSYFTGGSDDINTFFLENRKKYQELYGELDVRFITTMMINGKAYDALDAKDRVAFDNAIGLAKKHFDSSTVLSYVNSMEEKMLQAENRWSEAAKIFAARKKTPGFNRQEIFYFCSAATEKCSDQEVLKKCTGWMKDHIKNSPSFSAIDIYARLLYKTGSKKQGVAMMRKAIVRGKQNKEDVKASEDWLKKNQP